MANYFKFFPKTSYFNSDSSNSLDNVTNLTMKWKFNDAFKENTLAYYDYVVKDGETPEMIAHKLYDSSERHWIILAVNDIVHPQFDWPFNTQTLIQYIEDKYIQYANTSIGETGFEWAQSNFKDYYFTEKKTIKVSGDYTERRYELTSNNYSTFINSSNDFTLDDGTEINISTTRNRKTYYEYELDLNESKRNIKLLKNEFISTLEEEFRKIL